MEQKHDYDALCAMLRFEHFLVMIKSTCQKDHVMRFSTSDFFYQSTHPRPVIHALKYFEFCFECRKDICEYVHNNDFVPCRIAQYHDYALFLISDKQHIFSNISANLKRNSKNI
jgi:hypothetical protein